jgi:poly-beta-hydroxyalkanoate depolymerase
MNNLYLMARGNQSPMGSSFFILVGAPDETEARRLAAVNENIQSCAADWYDPNLTMARPIESTETKIFGLVTEIHNGPNINPLL